MSAAALAQPRVQVQVKVDPALKPPGRATGPRTPEGKAAVSRNAVTHGLTCRDVLLPEEDGQALERFRSALIADWAPVGGEEHLLVERIVAAHWRLQRLWRVETGLYWYHREYQGMPRMHVTVAYLDDCRREQAFTRLGRQESTLNREYHTCARRLLAIQDLRRKGLRTPGALDDAAAVEPPQAADAPAAAPVAPAASPQTNGTSGEIAEQTGSAPPTGHDCAAPPAVPDADSVAQKPAASPATPWGGGGS